MTNCLIFGGNGFIGSHLAEGLVKKGYDVKAFDSFKNGQMNLDTVRDKIEIIKGDFFNETDVCNALKDVDYVFHYISTTTPATAIKNTIYDIESNIIGSVKLFENAVDNNVKKLFSHPLVERFMEKRQGIELVNHVRLIRLIPMQYQN